MKLPFISKMTKSTGRFAALGICAVLLSGCQSFKVPEFYVPKGQPGGLPNSAVSPSLQARANALSRQQTQLPTGPSAITGEVLGTGSTRVALLIPSSAPGNGGKVAAQYRNAAQMAIEDFGLARIQLIIKDTKGNVQPARLAANQAISEQASIVLGPVFSPNVQAASSITRLNNKPMIAFSSDTARAGNGVYLMSFATEADVNRTISYAVRNGKRRIAALLPNGAYGNTVEAALRQTLSNSGATLVSLKRYDYSGASIEVAAREMSVAAANADAIYIPDGGQVPGAFAGLLTQYGIDFKTKKLLGSGQWESVKLGAPGLAGAWFAGRDKRGFNNFASRYRARFGQSATLHAGLSYDAVSLVINLVRRYGQNALTRPILENRNGFCGVHGLFRFDPNGITSRGLSIYQVTGGAASVLESAPASFASGKGCRSGQS